MKLSQPIKSIAFLHCVLFLPSSCILAQAPEQDCSGAIVVTASPDTFPVYVGFGSTQELQHPQNTTCLQGGEENSVWITFTACDTGLLLFEITPSAPGDDFDWALYDFTNHTCADVFNGTNEVRCNYSAVPGETGLDTPYVMVSCGASEPNQCLPLHPYVGQRFLLLVNNHANTNTGFVLTFSGTATLCNTVGISEVRQNKFSLYPNPTNGMLQLKNLPAKNNLKVEVLNAYGSTVLETDLKGNGDNHLQLPALLADGFYVLRILEEGKPSAEEALIISR